MDIIKDLLGLLFKQPDGSMEATISVPLGSGYSVTEDRASRVALLTQAQSEAIAKFPAKLVDGEWVTECNFGLQHVGRAMGCARFDGLNANQIAAALPLDPEFREDTWDRAVAHAQKGGLAVFCWANPAGHGHVASVAARAMEWSHLWNALVPIVANVGMPEHQDFVMVSFAFKLAMRAEMKVYLWRPD